MYDLIIIGSGPAGLTAGIFAANANLKTLVISKEILNYQEKVGSLLLDFKSIQKEFESLKKQKSEFLEFQKKEVVVLEKNVVSFSVEIKSGALFYSKAVIVACGVHNTEFDLLTNKNFEGKIKVNGNMETNIPGIFAAGDVTETLANNLFTSAGQGAKAALSALNFCKK